MAGIKQLLIIPFAIFQGSLTGLIGVVCGIVYSIGGLIIDVLVSADVLSAEKMETPGISIGTLLAMGALIAMPVIFFAAGFVTGILEALLYNICSRWLGKIPFQFVKGEGRNTQADTKVGGC